MDWTSNLGGMMNTDSIINIFWDKLQLYFPLRALWSSSEMLNRRFGINPVNQDVLVIFSEEVREFVEAYSNYRISNFEGYKKDIVEEFSDVLVTGFQVMRAAGITDVNEVIEGIAKVIAKNDAKTHETHEFDPTSNKIVRRR